MPIYLCFMKQHSKQYQLRAQLFSNVMARSFSPVNVILYNGLSGELFVPWIYLVTGPEIQLVVHLATSFVKNTILVPIHQSHKARMQPSTVTRQRDKTNKKKNFPEPGMNASEYLLCEKQSPRFVVPHLLYAGYLLDKIKKRILSSCTIIFW